MELEAATERMNKAIRADHCHNCDRIFRVPGSYHQKNPNSPKLVIFDRLDVETAYSLDSLMDIFPPVEDKKSSRKSNDKTTTKKVVYKTKAGLSTHVRDLHDTWNHIVLLFRGLGKPDSTSERTKIDTSSSGYDYSYTRELLYNGTKPQEAANALKLRHNQEGISKDDEYISRTVNNARKDLSAYKGESTVDTKPMVDEYSKFTVEEVFEQLELYGEDHPTKYLRGKPRKNLENLVRILDTDPRYTGSIAYNAFLYRYELDRQPVRDTDITAVRLYIARNYGLEYAKDIVREAFMYMSERNQFHPVREYFEKCEKAWKAKNVKKDGSLKKEVSDLDLWLIKYAKAEDLPVIRAIARKTLIGSANRILNPGAELHTVLCLLGPQGCGKSSLFKVLASRMEWFRDSAISLAGGRDSYALLKGVLLYEWPEMVASKAKDAETVKAFISSPVDTYRAAYATFEEQYKRQVTFVASSNEIEVLRDPTGARRFWTVETGDEIDTEGLRKVVDMLWGEATYRARAAEAYHLTGDEPEQLREYQLQFSSQDTWISAIKTTAAKNPHWFSSGVTASTIFEVALKIPSERQHKGAQMRLASAMTAAGYIKSRVSEGSREYVWKRKAKKSKKKA